MPSFGDDMALLERHTDVCVLVGKDERERLVVAPAYQGRVMTSSLDGPDGASLGYVHRPGVEAGARQPHITVVGGEDRFWLGPEGGPFGLYFAPGAPFEFAHWQVPAPLDWEPWEVTSQGDSSIRLAHAMSLVNRAGTTLSLRVDRTIRLLDDDARARMLLGEPAPDLRVVAFESDNRVTNTGDAAWTPDTGLVSIWILGMFPPSPRTTVVVPLARSSASAKVNDAYFGSVGPDRLAVENQVAFFRGDGCARGKIGVPPARVRPLVGSYDADAELLTLVEFSLTEARHGYVDSAWRDQEDPFAGDVLNAYNDGPVGPGGTVLGPFYELETSSAALALTPGATGMHLHRTLHAQGPRAALDALARARLGVSLDKIERSLPYRKEG